MLPGQALLTSSLSSDLMVRFIYNFFWLLWQLDAIISVKESLLKSSSSCAPKAPNSINSLHDISVIFYASNEICFNRSKANNSNKKSNIINLKEEKCISHAILEISDYDWMTPWLLCLWCFSIVLMTGCGRVKMFTS